MRKILSIIALLLLAFSLSALEIILKDGRRLNFPIAEFALMEQQDFVTSRTREEGTRRDSWRGIRLDNWLKENNLRDWTSIRFESEDRYLATFEQVVFDTTACWLATHHNGQVLEPSQYRVIFPNLTQNHWLRNLERIVLEDFSPIDLPKRIYPLHSLLGGIDLIDNPEPFVNLRGYRFEDLMRALRGGRKADVIFYSEDGYKLRLDYPYHLQGAVLAVLPSGKLELKSPQIPGGMWLKDIIYIQVNKRAVLESTSQRRLINLAQEFKWSVGPLAQVKIWQTRGSRSLEFAEFLRLGELPQNTRYFRLYKTK